VTGDGRIAEIAIQPTSERTDKRNGINRKTTCAESGKSRSAFVFLRI
jgi:hypothetical protein